MVQAMHSAINSNTAIVLLLLLAAPLYGQPDEGTRVIFTPQPLDAAETTESLQLLEEPLPPAIPAPFGKPEGGTPGTPELERTIARYQQAADQLIAEGGAYNVELTENLAALGEAQLQAGNTEEALRLFEQAFHITRIHGGLFSAGQIPLIESITRTLVEMGHFTQAHDRQDYLYYLRYKLHPEDNTANLDALLDLAGWSLGIATLAYERDFDQTATFQFNRLIESSIYFSNAADYLQDVSPTDPRLPGIQRDRAVSNYQLARLATLFDSASALEISPDFRATSPIISEHNAAIDTSAGYGQGFTSNYSTTLSYYRASAYNNGEEALRERFAYLSQHATHIDAIRAKVDLADWYLVFQRRNDALETYSEALNLWEQAELDEDRKLSLYDELFYPATPRNIPTLASPWVSRQGDPAGFHGYIDLAFNVTRYGTTQRVQITGNSDDTSASMIRDLRGRINDAIFRPRFLDAEPVANDAFSLRYYYTLVRETSGQAAFIEAGTEQ